MCYIFNKNITHFLKYVNRYYDLIYEYTLYNWSSTFLVNSRKETPGLVSVRNVRYGPELWEKSANSHKRTLVAYRTKKSKIFLAKKRINCLPFGGECAIITEQDCDTICDEAGGCGWFSRFFRGVCPIVNRATRIWEVRGHALLACYSPGVRHAGISGAGTPAWDMIWRLLRRFLFVHTRILLKLNPVFKCQGVKHPARCEK